MYIDFDQLPDQARVWVYQANRTLSSDETDEIRALLQTAIAQWAAHGEPLLASTQLIQNQFIVIGVDEGYNLPSGCSIDASARTLQEIGRQMHIDFFDRSVAVLSADGAVHTYALPAIKTAIAEKQLLPDSLLINTLVKTKAEFKIHWHVRVADSWLKRYFKSVNA